MNTNLNVTNIGSKGKTKTRLLFSYAVVYPQIYFFKGHGSSVLVNI